MHKYFKIALCSLLLVLSLPSAHARQHARDRETEYDTVKLNSDISSAVYRVRDRTDSVAIFEKHLTLLPDAAVGSERTGLTSSRLSLLYGCLNEPVKIDRMVWGRRCIHASRRNSPNYEACCVIHINSKPDLAKLSAQIEKLSVEQIPFDKKIIHRIVCGGGQSNTRTFYYCHERDGIFVTATNLKTIKDISKTRPWLEWFGPKLPAVREWNHVVQSAGFVAIRHNDPRGIGVAISHEYDQLATLKISLLSDDAKFLEEKRKHFEEVRPDLKATVTPGLLTLEYRDFDYIRSKSLELEMLELLEAD